MYEVRTICSTQIVSPHEVSRASLGDTNTWVTHYKEGERDRERRGGERRVKRKGRRETKEE